MQVSCGEFAEQKFATRHHLIACEMMDVSSNRRHLSSDSHHPGCSPIETPAANAAFTNISENLAALAQNTPYIFRRCSFPRFLSFQKQGVEK